MNKTNERALNVFRDGGYVTSGTASVRPIKSDAVPKGQYLTGLFSYDLLVGLRYPDGEVALLPIPNRDASKDEGGSKTTRTLIQTAMGRFPKHIKMIPSPKG